jgi:ribosome-associated translation inhibitor RaiA
MNTTLRTEQVTLSKLQEQRILHRLHALGRRLQHFPEPKAELVLRSRPTQRHIAADLRVQLGPLAAHLISHQQAETADHAARLAVEDVERQLERRLASLRR